MYQNGYGVEKSAEQAREYYQQAVDNGVEGAEDFLNSLPAGE